MTPPSQLPRVRGSPLLRSLLVAIALVTAGAALVRLTSARTPVLPAPPVAGETPAATGSSPFRLLLSNPAREVLLDTGSGEPLRLVAPTSPIAGRLSLDPRNPHVAIIVRWMEPPGPDEHRFAKLTIEPPGQPTITRHFDAGGDIDDFQELPMSIVP